MTLTLYIFLNFLLCKAKQYRKTNRRGQPKLKHRVESILERLQEMRKEDNQQ